MPVYGGEQLTLSGMVLANMSEPGAYCKVTFLDANRQIIAGSTVETGHVTSAPEFTRLSGLVIAPSQARYARVSAISVP